MKKNFKRTSLAIAMGLLGLGAAGNAYAGAYTFASTEVTLALYDGAGGVQGAILTAGDFSTLSITNQSSTLANLVSVAGVSFQSSPTSGDSLQAYQGYGAAPAENTFTPEGTGSWYSRADTNLQGTLIAGLGAAPNVPPATANTISEISLLGNDIGQANSNLSNNTGFVFVLGSDRQVFLDLSAITASVSSLSNDALNPPSIVGSSATWTVSITDNVTGTTVFNWSPDGQAGGISGGTELLDEIDLSFGTSISTPGASASIAESGDAQAYTDLLLAGRGYTFRIVQTASSDATLEKQVPEPSVVALMGLGLLGAGATRLKRKKSA